MIDQVREYIEYLLEIKFLDKPKMPKFDTSAYTDIEYQIAIENVEEDFQYIDDLYLTLQYLKGD